MKIFYQIIFLFKTIKNDFFVDSLSKNFINYCKQKWKNNYRNKRKEILIELYSVDQTVLAFSFFANILANKLESKLISFSLSERHPALIYFRYRRLVKIYKSFNTDAHINTILDSSQVTCAEKIYEIIKLNVKAKKNINKISINGDVIGNEIYEAFLRECRLPTIDITSKKFSDFLLKCIKTYVFWNDYFLKNQVSAVVLSHGIYRFGIIRIIACKYGVPVYLPTVRSLYYLKKANETGLPMFNRYPALFKKLTIKEKIEAIDWAKKRLALRFSGVIGVDMSYSEKSAFLIPQANKLLLKKNNRIKVLIATHCFFDNPYAYGNNLFTDFFEWLTFLGEISEKTNYDWYLKTHPDVLPGNNDILRTLLMKYKKIKMLPSESSHLQIIKEGINFVLTTYGSVGHEFPLHDVIVINAGDKNPHRAYNFNIHPKTLSEYREYLLNLELVKLNKNSNKIYEFYFMHHKYFSNQNLFFDSFEAFLEKYSVKKQNSSFAYEYFLNNSDDTHVSKKISDFIDSRRYCYLDRGSI